MKKGIILSTLNARYTHASLGLRYLYANLGDLQALSQVMEFTISMRPIDIAEQLLAEKPLIIGFGIYIWNVIETTSLIEIIKSVSPETVIVLGGPEISYETNQQPVAALADYIITGAGEVAFRQLCEQL